MVGIRVSNTCPSPTSLHHCPLLRSQPQFVRDFVMKPCMKPAFLASSLRRVGKIRPGIHIGSSSARVWAGGSPLMNSVFDVKMGLG